jgi:hypothetical protein
MAQLWSVSDFGTVTRISFRQITDDNLWRPTRRAEEHYTKNKLSTRRGAVHSIGWLCRSPVSENLSPTRS